MWIGIKDKLYNLDKYRVIQGDVMPNGKTYLSLTGNDGETRISMKTEELTGILGGILDVQKQLGK